jgi:hypothetical protein
MRIDMGQIEDHSSHSIIILITLLVSIVFPRTPLAVSSSIIQLNFGLSLETGKSKTLATSCSLCSFFGTKYFSDNLSHGGVVEGSGFGVVK